VDDCVACTRTLDVQRVTVVFPARRLEAGRTRRRTRALSCFGQVVLIVFWLLNAARRSRLPWAGSPWGAS